MADSDVVLVTVGGPTTFAGFYVAPTSGAAPLSCRAAGWLRLVGGNPKDTVMNGELIHIQIFDGTRWVDLNTGYTTTDSDGNTGAFVIFFTISAPGTFQIRAHYDGNVSKGLGGCEKDSATVVTSGVPSIPLWKIGLALLTVAGAGAGVYVVTKGGEGGGKRRLS